MLHAYLEHARAQNAQVNLFVDVYMIWYLEVTPAVGVLGCVCGNFSKP
jgi:hypothetical protein